MRTITLCLPLLVVGGATWFCGGGGVSPQPVRATSVSDTCSPSSIFSNQTSQCSATVQGTGNFSTSVGWTTSLGPITASGLYTAPTVTVSTPVTITATSVQD